MAFASGSNCFTEEPLRIHLQRNAASQCFSGKLSDAQELITKAQLGLGLSSLESRRGPKAVAEAKS